MVDRQPLVKQWRERLGEHLGTAIKEIGQFSGGRNKAKGAIDIPMAQGLACRTIFRTFTVPHMTSF